MAETDKFNEQLKDVVSDVLKGMEVLSITPEQAVPAGEHYLSTLLRVVVKYKTSKGIEETTTVIVKARPKGILSEFIELSGVFVKEMIVYNRIMPLIHEILNFDIAPKQLSSLKDDLLVLEDLKIKRFQMKNRIDKLDFQHAKETVRMMADLHAGSVMVHDKQPELFDEIKVEKMYTDDNLYMHNLVVHNFRLIADEFENIPNLSKYSARLRHIGEKTWNSVKEALVPRVDVLNVLNHGDLWTTNIMFCYDEDEKVKEVRFVDFQFCRWGSPAFDLQFFYSTSIRDRKWMPELTSIYLERLNQLIPNSLSPEQLENEMRRLDCCGLLLAICTLGICVTDPQTPLDFGETTSEDFINGFPKDRPNPYLTAIRDERYLKIIPEFLEFYDQMGLF